MLAGPRRHSDSQPTSGSALTCPRGRSAALHHFQHHSANLATALGTASRPQSALGGPNAHARRTELGGREACWAL